jgi:folate-binding protein YgfZ
LSPEHAQRHYRRDGFEVLAVATDLGVDLIVGKGDAEELQGALADSGAAPISEAAAEIARVESGRPRFGREMTTATIPAEAGIDERAVSFTKGCYIGQETVARLHYKGKPNRHLRGLRLSAPAKAGAELRLGDKAVGEIGTACLSPVHGPIALAVVRREAEPGETLDVAQDGVTATLTDLPFG